MFWNGNEFGKKESNENLKATIPSTECDKQKKKLEYEILQTFG